MQSITIEIKYIISSMGFLQRGSIPSEWQNNPYLLHSALKCPSDKCVKCELFVEEDISSDARN